MTTSKSILIAASTALLLSLGTATYEGLQWSDARAMANAAEQSAATAKLERDRVARELATGLASVPIPATPSAQINRASSRASAPAQGSATAGASLSAAAQRGQDLIERHPEVRAALLKWADEGVEAMFGPVLKELQLTPVEIAAFKAVHRATGYATTLGSNRELYQFDVSADPIPPEAYVKLKEMLGPEREARLANYAKERWVRAQTQSIVSSLMWVEPLSSAQAEQLVSYVAASQLEPFRINWDQLNLKAKPLLSSQQLNIIDGLGKRDVFDRAMMKSIKVP